MLAHAGFGRELGTAPYGSAAFSCLPFPAALAWSRRNTYEVQGRNSHARLPQLTRMSCGNDRQHDGEGDLGNKANYRKAGNGHAHTGQASSQSYHKEPSKVLRAPHRRKVLRGLAILSAASLHVLCPSSSYAEGLLARLAKRDWTALSKPMLPSIVALPLQEQVFPDWILGTWEVSSTFAGFELPVKTLSKQTLMADKSIPGFQKLSIAQLPDVGAPGRFQLRFTRRSDGKVVQDNAKSRFRHTRGLRNLLLDINVVYLIYCLK